ncbi:hypothetical protein F4819DRAFT_505827 [Hypoxylon fuscum]|nr:hypothetical protein F4819DRAFT_505827 [Hypoxylon fuscum]
MSSMMDSLQSNHDGQDGQDQPVDSRQAQNFSDGFDNLEFGQLVMIGNQRKTNEKIDYLVESQATGHQLENIHYEFVPAIVNMNKRMDATLENVEKLAKDLRAAKTSINRQDRKMGSHWKKMESQCEMMDHMQATLSRIESQIQPSEIEENADAVGTSTGSLFALLLIVVVTIGGYKAGGYFDLSQYLGAIMASLIAIFALGWYQSRG